MLPAEPATDHEIWHLAWCWERERLSRGGIRVTANQGLHSLWNLGGEPPLWEISSRFCRPQPKVSHLTQSSSDSKKALKQCQTLSPGFWARSDIHKLVALGRPWNFPGCVSNPARDWESCPISFKGSVRIAGYTTHMFLQPQSIVWNTAWGRVGGVPGFSVLSLCFPYKITGECGMDNRYLLTD